MNSKTIIAALALTAFSLPALAATQYYVVKNDSTKKCELSEAKADGKKLMEVDKVVYKTKIEAETAMNAAKNCK